MLPIDQSAANQESPERSRSQNAAILQRFFSSLQNTLDNKISHMCVKIDGIGNRLESLEARQKNLEEEVRLTASSSTSLASSPALSTPGRKRQTPVALQVSVG